MKAVSKRETPVSLDSGARECRDQRHVEREDLRFEIYRIDGASEKTHEWRCSKLMSKI